MVAIVRAETDLSNPDGMPPPGDDAAAAWSQLEEQATDGVPPVPGEAPPPPPPRVDLAKEFKGVATFVAGFAGKAFPSLKEVYTPDTINDLADAAAAVCVKHGWLTGGFTGAYAEEMALLLVAGPLALATVDAIEKDRAAIARAKRGELGAPAEPGAAPAPGAQSVTMEFKPA